MRAAYRTQQFWKALHASPTCEQLEQIEAVLSPKLLSLFCAMQPDEQAHSYSVFNSLVEKGDHHPDLLVAALLHDAGKSLHRLRLWERVLVVIGQTLFPKQSKIWGVPGGRSWERSWRRAFVIAEQHPLWGAQMAEQAGASPLVVRLIRWHQADPYLSSTELAEAEKDLLEKLRRLDGLK
jgi:hypothetical protein